MSPHNQAISHLCLGPLGQHTPCYAEEKMKAKKHITDGREITSQSQQGENSGNKSTGSINPASHSCRLFRNH